jgi:hypothetical protein
VTDLKTALWCDLTTDAERSTWLLLGRGYETGVVAKAMQNDFARAYQRLAQPVSEPVAWIDAPERIYLQVCDVSDCDEPFCDHHDVSWCQDKINDSDVEYIRADTAPPQRKEWQGLTDGEVDEAAIVVVQNKLKEKNGSF